MAARKQWDELRIVEVDGFWKSIGKRRTADVEMLYFDLGMGLYKPMNHPLSAIGLKKPRYGTGSQHAKSDDGYMIILADYVMKYGLIVLMWAFPATEVKDFDDLEPAFRKETKKAKLRLDVLVETGRL